MEKCFSSEATVKVWGNHYWYSNYSNIADSLTKCVISLIAQYNESLIFQKYKLSPKRKYISKMSDFSCLIAIGEIEIFFRNNSNKIYCYISGDF
jgi:hypothetical protein